jgi:hypothetical protein
MIRGFEIDWNWRKAIRNMSSLQTGSVCTCGGLPKGRCVGAVIPPRVRRSCLSAVRETLLSGRREGSQPLPPSFFIEAATLYPPD